MFVCVLKNTFMWCECLYDCVMCADAQPQYFRVVLAPYHNSNLQTSKWYFFFIPVKPPTLGTASCRQISWFLFFFFTFDNPVDIYYYLSYCAKYCVTICAICINPVVSLSLLSKEKTWFLLFRARFINVKDRFVLRLGFSVRSKSTKHLI